jgi:hypothetical protein
MRRNTIESMSYVQMYNKNKQMYFQAYIHAIIYRDFRKRHNFPIYYVR